MIRITRGNERSGRWIGYMIFIDDVYQGKIRINETKAFAVDNGTHTVYVENAGGRSKPFYAHINDSIVELEVGDALTGWKGFFWQYVSPFMEKDEFLFIRETTPEDTPK